MKTVPLEELDPRTGAWLREAGAQDGVLVTKQGEPFITIEPSPSSVPKRTRFNDWVLLPEFAAIMGQLSGGTDSTDIISQDRDRDLA